MSFSTKANKSVSDFIALAQIELPTNNIQWVNIGAGIWYVNFDAIYSYVDSSLLDYFTAQDFTKVTKILCDGIELNSVATLALVTTTDACFFYDSTNKNIYIKLAKYDDPYIHSLNITTATYYSDEYFTPIGQNNKYIGDIDIMPDVAISKDPLFFGVLSFSSGQLNLINSAGSYDLFLNENDLLGGAIRFYAGFKSEDFSEFQIMYSGDMDSATLDESYLGLSFTDSRKNLTKAILHTCTDENALTCIENLMLTNYNIPYTADYYNITDWETAKALAKNITIDLKEPEAIIDIIQQICVSVGGFFFVGSDGKYSFTIVDIESAAIGTIYAIDIVNKNSISYSFDEIITNTRIGYNKNWADNTYTWLDDNSQQLGIYRKAKKYILWEAQTYLTNSDDAQWLSSKVLNYTKGLHGIGSVSVPLKYYTFDVGDIVNIEIQREKTTMLGTVKCEIISKNISLKNGFITFGYRII